MPNHLFYLLAADLLLLVHTLFVAFVVLGLIAIYLGGAMGWAWVRSYTFRLCHLLAILFVVLQTWLGQTCPLTLWENSLRAKAGAATYTGSFIAHWLEWLLYYRAPEWVFVLVYSVFAGLVLLSWVVVPPGRQRRSS